MKPFRSKLSALVFAVVFLFFPHSLHACSVCFGDPSSPLVIGAKYGVIVLALVIYSVLFTMAGIGYVWYRRAKALEASELTEDDAI